MFVSWNEQQTGTTKNKALNRARVRAHAARFAHQRTLDLQTKAKSSGAHDSNDDHRLPQHPSFPGSIIVWRGNSDPFHSEKVEITPRLNQILNFLQNVWIPATHVKLPAPFPGVVRSCFCSQRMIQPLSSSKDHALIVANLLPTASALAMLTKDSDLEQYSTRLKTMTVTQLRTRIDQAHSRSGGRRRSAAPPDFSREEQRNPKAVSSVSWFEDAASPANNTVIDLTKTLFVTAVNECNYAEAEAHGKMLRWLMRLKANQKGYAAIQADELCHALGYDLVRAQSTSTASLFDVDEWVPACLEAHKIPILDDLAAFRQHVLNKLDQSARDTPLQSVFLGTHQCFKLWTKADDPSTKLNPGLIWTYVTLSNLLLQLQTTNYSLRVEEVLRSPSFTSSPGQQLQVYWRVQACLAYSVLLWQLTNLVDIRVAERSYWPRGTMIAGALRGHIKSYYAVLARSDEFCDVEHFNALLYSYWTGATWHRKSMAADLNVDDSFFHHGLHTLARMRDLRCAEDVKIIVESFLPSIHMRPQDWDWLDIFLQQCPPSLSSIAFAKSGPTHDSKPSS